MCPIFFSFLKDIGDSSPKDLIFAAMMDDRYNFLQAKLNFPEIELKIEEMDGKLNIFDSLRKKYLILSPEEWVRQHMITFLVQFRNYPKSLFAIEKGLKYNQLQKRSDILIVDRKGDPFLLIECKAPEVKLTQKTMEQVTVYNQSVQAAFVGISNGVQHLFFAYDRASNNYKQIQGLPEFKV
ncbi:hypothetical protein A33Q_0018 [Indibacter alkaliphilus LW1]|jgi:hypothetical protein|uniref:Type I restriction enzyme R protein N-terminal domain-containing protein n=1 Tax=Indibacter alkaliphilus (strain CCUG 57479 / KCTC 22604 / LW1) TaxID=1189612 RepID=S2DN94_INDAL|nr:type I restriction enzyme HsdR N-terminal domain-containing protein [Indibacter alkaliphilus]EPA00545.1 hypothetical protein A33Q_0018 [Indibacter alkaliphilus LW1]